MFSHGTSTRTQDYTQSNADRTVRLTTLRSSLLRERVSDGIYISQRRKTITERGVKQHVFQAW